MALRFKLDENLPRRVESTLRDLGHDVQTTLSEGLAGAPDPDLLAACAAEDRVLVTLDLDFADIRAYPLAVIAVSGYSGRQTRRSTAC